MSSRPKPSKYDKELLTFGYIRCNSRYSVPIAINRLCLQYFDEVFYITLRGKELKKFWNLESEKYIQRSFKYNNDVSFKCTIFPNGCSNEEPEFVDFFVNPMFDKNKILNVIYRATIECDQTNTKATMSIYGEQSGWQDGTMRVNEYGDIEIIKQLLFTVYVDIDCIEYKDKPNWYKPLKMHRNISFEWNMDKELLQKFKECKWGKHVESDSFDDNCWILRYYPNGDHIGRKGKCVLLLALLRIPPNIKEIGCNLQAKLEDIDETKDKDNLYFRRDRYAWFFEWNDDKIKLMDTLHFHLNIQITHLVNDDDEELDPTKWNDLDYMI